MVFITKNLEVKEEIKQKNKKQVEILPKNKRLGGVILKRTVYRVIYCIENTENNTTEYYICHFATEEEAKKDTIKINDNEKIVKKTIKKIETDY